MATVIRALKDVAKEILPTPAKKTEDSIITKPVDDSMRIDSDELRNLLFRTEIGDKPIAIISVVGQMRTGKSFLLNFFLRYLRKKGWENPNWIGDKHESIGRDGLPWRGGRNRCTTGIRVFSELFEMPMAGGGKMAVMLMDTQGLFDHLTPENMNKTLLTLSTLASSVQIFNCMQQINSQHLEYLKTCVDFAKATAQGSGSGFVKLQRLMFLIRDFPEDYEGADDDYTDEDNYSDDDEPSSSYGLAHGEKYLGEILDSEEGNEEMVLIRKGIKESFGEVQCFPMPTPGDKVGKKNFKGANKELSEEFLENIKTFVEEVASPGHLFPKCSREKTMTARELLNMLCSCDKSFAEQKFGSVSLVQANTKAYYEARYKEALDQYTKNVEAYIEEQKALNLESLEAMHRETKEKAIKMYNEAPKMGSGEEAKTYLVELENQCEKLVEQHKERINLKQETERIKKKMATNSAVAEYEKEMEKVIMEENFSKQHEACFADLRKKYADKADLEMLSERVMELYEKLRTKNEEHIEDKKKASGRESYLKNLVHYTLCGHCAETWEKEIEVIRKPKDIDIAQEKIKKKIEKSYWNEALTEEEKVEKKVLLKRFDDVFNLIEAAQRKRSTTPMTSLTTEEDKPKPNESKYKTYIRATVQEFEADLKMEMPAEDAEGRLRKENLVRSHSTKFAGLCSSLLTKFHEDLMKALESKYENAKKANEKNWKTAKKLVSTEIKGKVSELEKKLGKDMSDRHLCPEVLEEKYGLARNATNPFMSRFPPKIRESERVKEKMTEVLKNELSTSLEKIKNENEKNKWMRAATDSGRTDDESGWWCVIQ